MLLRPVQRPSAARRAAAEKAAAERAARQVAAGPATAAADQGAACGRIGTGAEGRWPGLAVVRQPAGALRRQLPDGRTSSGVLIGAPAGSTVTAVADGTVVFSDWMTGYGMILIVDHGNGYMSLYAHNYTLLKDAGARVSRGDAVAKVGNSGGQGVTALYFELRRGGQPVNPDSWLQRR